LPLGCTALRLRRRKIGAFLVTPLAAPMPLFRRPHYRSDTTVFLDDLKAKHPNLEAQQRHGRALLWDRTQNPEWREQFAQARVAQPAYVYQTSPRGAGE